MIKSFKFALENSEEWQDTADLGLFCSAFRFQDAKPKTNIINVEGANGSVDLSEVLTGDVVFNNVSGTVGFIVLRGSNFDVDEFRNKYNGKRMKFIADNDTTHYRVGRMTIYSDDKARELRQVTMTVDADAFRYDVDENVVEVPIVTNYSTDSGSISASGSFTATKSDGYIIVGNSKITNNHIAIIGGNKTTLYNELMTITLDCPVEQNKKYLLKMNLNCAERTSSSLNGNSGVKFFNTISKAGAFITVGGEETAIIDLTGITSAPKTYGGSVYFESGNETSVNVKIYGRLCYYAAGASSIAADSEIMSVSDFALVPVEEIVLPSGRKRVTPTIYSAEDCFVVANGVVTDVSAGEAYKNFEIEISNERNNLVSAYGDKAGTVEIRYRNGEL